MPRKKRAFAEETSQERALRTVEIADRLDERHPDAGVALAYRNPLQLMVATILSAQCTDERVNQVTPLLFGRFPDAATLSAASLEEIEEIIHPTGFFRQKAKSIKGSCVIIMERFGGEVPREMDDLTSLPGIGRKTANVVRGGAWGYPGITVDTHVKRLSGRLGLTNHSDPVKIEYDLNDLLPEERWFRFSSVLIFHGRRVCNARKPDCANCTLTDLCRHFIEETDGD
ncbi:endonuclease III [Gemmatimonadota bacterium]